MIKVSITIQELVDFLNSLLLIDPNTISALFSLRLGCNEALANHETVQIGVLGNTHCMAGIIGILNGAFGVDEYDWGHISASYKNGMITKFEALTSKEIAEIIEKNKR